MITNIADPFPWLFVTIWTLGAVVDDGVDFSHPDLAGRQWTNPGESGAGKENNGIDDDGNGYVDDVNGWDFVSKDKTVHDADDSHGTHVASTIAASVNNQGIVGVAPNVKVMALKFMGPEGGSVSDAISAIGYAKSKGVKILNASWGYEGSPDPALKDAIGTSGMLFVTGAGNGGLDGVGDDNDTDPNNATYPASYDSPNILSVAAINNKGNLAAFSNYGSTSVDIAAPGVDILGAVPGTPARSAATLSSVGASGKALVSGFGAEEIDGAANQASFMGQAFTAVGRGVEPIVLVDDDRSHAGTPDIGPPVSTAIQSATGVAPQVISVADGDGPNLAQLQGKTVVWATGKAFTSGPGSTTLTSADQQTLTDFLNSGGKLVLTGMDALYQVEESSFVRNVLQLSVQGDSGTVEFAGSAGTGFSGQSYNLTSSFASASYHDVLLPAPSSGTAVATQGVYPGSAGSWTLGSGTSAAAPHASGVAALAASSSSTLLNDPVALKNHLMSKGKATPATVGRIASGKMLDAKAAVSTDTIPPDAPSVDLAAASDSGSSSTDDITNDNTPTLTGAAEANSTVKVYDGAFQIGATTASGTGVWSFTPGSALADGAHPFKATATDAAGNASADSAILSVTIDTTAPDTTIDSGPSGTVGPNPSNFTFSSNETGGTFECRLDGAPYSACSSPQSYTSLSGGSHIFDVRATDRAGNTDQAPASRAFTVDATAPTVNAPVEDLISPSTLGTTAIPVKLNWSGSDAGSGVARYELQRSVNGGAYSAVSLPSATATTLTLSLDQGTHRFRVRAQDTVGNWSAWIHGPSFVLSAYQETNAKVTYPAGTWTAQSASAFYGGSAKYSPAAGAKARFTFTGGEVAWVSSKSAARGRAEVWIDGVKAATVDLYSATVQNRQMVFRKSGLAPSTTHTLEVRVLGTKNASSTGTRVDADAFVTIN